VSIRDLRDEARAQKTKIHADVELAEIELRRELEKDSPDEKRVVAIIDKISGLEAQARKTEILAQLKIRALTPKEQRKKVETELVDPLQGLYAPSDPMLRAEEELRRAQDQRERDRAYKRDLERAEREYEKARGAHGFGAGAGVGKSKGEGTLTVNSIPASRVLIDGREIGMTPLRAVALPAGMHTVKMIVGDREFTNSVVVVQGQDTRLIKRFD
jgi:PEGA domain